MWDKNWLQLVHLTRFGCEVYGIWRGGISFNPWLYRPSNCKGPRTVLTPSVPQGHFWATRTTTLSATGPLLGHWFAG